MELQQAWCVGGFVGHKEPEVDRLLSLVHHRFQGRPPGDRRMCSTVPGALRQRTTGNTDLPVSIRYVGNDVNIVQKSQFTAFFPQHGLVVQITTAEHKTTTQLWAARLGRTQYSALLWVPYAPSPSRGVWPHGLLCKSSRHASAWSVCILLLSLERGSLVLPYQGTPPLFTIRFCVYSSIYSVIEIKLGFLAFFFTMLVFLL